MTHGAAWRRPSALNVSLLFYVLMEYHETPDALVPDAAPHGGDKASALYDKLCDGMYLHYPFDTEDLGEGVRLLKQVICGYWKPRYLINPKTYEAYELLDSDERFVAVTPGDIAWDTLAGLPEAAVDRARRLSAHFPTLVGRFAGGVAEVRWELNPDGRYYMDDSGFGMTDDEEITVYGFIDRTARVVEKFRLVSGRGELERMRAAAEASVKA